MLETAGTQVYLAERVKDAFDEPANLDIHTNGSPPRAMRLRLTPLTTTERQDRNLTAIYGIIAQRNAWALGPERTAEWRGPRHPRLLVQAHQPQLYKKPYGDNNFEEPAPLSSLTPISRRLVLRHQEIVKRSLIQIDFYYTFDSDWKRTESDGDDDPRLTKLCTATWETSPEYDHFRRIKSGSIFRRSLWLGDIDFTLKWSMFRDSVTGPKFEMAMVNGATRKRKGDLGPWLAPDSIVWHCEPPHVVWPTRAVR